MGYQLIETIEVGAGGAASIEFTGIPQDGVDLVVKASMRSVGTSTNEQINFRINNNSGSIYSLIGLQGFGSGGVYSLSLSGGNAIERTYIPGADMTASTFGSLQFYFSNYTSADTKSISADFVTENNGGIALQQISAISANDTNAITSIQIFDSNNFVEYSTASLYKITAD
jgi:hypothetical protein